MTRANQEGESQQETTVMQANSPIVNDLQAVDVAKGSIKIKEVKKLVRCECTRGILLIDRITKTSHNCLYLHYLL
jgi:hypothetical protein